ncbi:DUF4402 domain-containing protein [Deltaproteobacteria bacterium TL4]
MTPLFICPTQIRLLVVFMIFLTFGSWCVFAAEQNFSLQMQIVRVAQPGEDSWYDVSIDLSAGESGLEEIEVTVENTDQGVEIITSETTQGGPGTNAQGNSTSSDAEKKKDLSVRRAFVIRADSPSAAKINIIGEKNRLISSSIKESQLALYNANGKSNITIQKFTFGGDLQGNGQGTISSENGSLSAAIGVTAVLPEKPLPGVYTGKMTFVVVYN